MPAVYLYTSNSKNTLFFTEDYKPYSAYFTTRRSINSYFTTEDYSPKKAYFTTKNSKNTYFITEEFKAFKAYFTTQVSKNYVFYTEPLDTEEFPNICHYPKELDIIRNKAILLIWKELKGKLYSSLDKESWGKADVCGYYSAGHLRLLLDYLSSIWLERDNDSKSGLVRTADYYYTKYGIADIIASFRKCDINIRDIVALFNLNSYTVIDGDWPNYFIINNLINPPTEEETLTLKQYTDIFTLDGSVLPDSNQSKYPLTNSQTHFSLTKEMKYLASFLINGSDYIGYVDYNKTSVTYSPSVLNGYTITNSDTVTITYWYEE
jgi:hypothetical protein